MSATLDPHRREAARLAELDRLGAMQPEADRVLQELVDDAREVFGTEFCMVNLVTADTQFFKAYSSEVPPEVAAVGQSPRERTMCRYVVEDEQPFVVEDFFATERFKEQHLRMGPGVRFYAGTPLKTFEGHAVGSLCLVDSRPREFDDKDGATLRAFARAVVGRLEALGAAAHEREAKESERQYRHNVFELANDAILIYDPETGPILDANRRACEMYGIPQGGIAGKNVAELASDPEETEEHLRNLLRRGSHRGFETVHRKVDGTPIYVSINSSVTEYDGRRAVLSIIRDITGRKRSEEEIRNSAARNKAILETSPDLVFLFNRAGELLDFEAAAKEAQLYVPTEGIIGRKLGDMMPTEIAETALHSIARALDTGEMQVYEYGLPGQDGPRDFEARLVKSGTDEVLSIVRDVTERKRTERTLRRSERSLAQAQRIAHIGNWEHELGDNRTRWSDEMYRIFGFAPGDLVPSYKTFILFVHPDDKRRVQRSVRDVLRGKGSEGIEYRIVRPNGEVRSVHTQYEAVYDRADRPTKFFGTVQDVTERKQVEQKLREAEERYRTLVEQIPAVAYIDRADVADVPFYTSPRIEALLGYTPEEWLNGRLWLERLHPEDRERVLAANDRSNATGDPFDEEYRMIARDGREVWLHDASVVLRGAEGGPSYRQGVMYDVTERRQTQEALHASEMRLRTVIEQSPLGIHIFAPDGTSLLTNEAWDKLWYLDAEEAAQEGNVFEDEQLRDAGLIRYIERSAEEGAAVVAPLLLFDPANTGREGCPRWLRTLIYPVKGGDGRVLETVLMLEDFTERKWAEDALKESEIRYRAVIEQSAEAIWLFDPETKRVLEANAAFQEMLGYDAEELRGMTNYDFVDHSREDVDRAVMRKLQGDKTLREERKYRTKDGTLLDVEVGGTVISYRGKSVVCSVARDITERKRVEEEIREANRRLSELATLKADFTAMVAHELDTPLAVIRGYADVIATGELGPAEREQALSRIQDETEVLNALVEDVRVAASAEREDFTVNPRRVRVGGLLEDAARFVATLSKGHPIILEGAVDDTPWEGVRAGYADPFVFKGGADGQGVWADRYRIGQVLRNLLTNAVKHSPEGTPIELRAVRDEAAGRVRIEVIDHGPGVHPDDMERIFEKFGRGRDPEGRKVSGLGLGLYLSRRILQAHGSDLEVNAAPDGGSVFSFDLESDR